MSQPLTDSLTAYIRSLPPTVRVSVALESLADSSERFYYRADERVPSASLIKVPIMVAAMTAAQAGKLDLDEIHILTDSEKVGGAGILQTYPNRSRISYTELVRLMITISDNTATNILISDLGREAINTQMQSWGMTQSRLNRVMMDTLAARQGRENYVTAREMNQLLTKIHEHKLLTPALCEQMLTFLKQNEDTLTIPHLLPPQANGKPVVVAHKTGVLAYVRGDAGIVFAPRPFVLTVLVENAGTEAAGEQTIADLAFLVWKIVGKIR
ncbi:MAG: serine hydrolase [Cytophagales bacterium]|nr:MAG: serine hydrolase [Cytophagales bacterium]